MTKMLAPTLVTNPRHDVTVAFPTGEPARQTVYSGHLYIGEPAPAAGSVNTTRRTVQFAGAIPLPDSLPYHSAGLVGSSVSADVWITSKSAHDYLLVDDIKPVCVPDQRDPAFAWVQLCLRYLAPTGSVLGYRVTVTATSESVSA